MSDATLRRTTTAGTEIFREGEYGACAYVVEEGEVEIWTKRGGERVLLATRGPGEIFGEMAIVDNKPRSASVSARTDCTLLLLSADQLRERLDQLDPVLKMVMRVILERFRDSMRQIQNDAPLVRVDTPAGTAVDAKMEAYRAVLDRLELEQSLRHALDAGELELFFQPIVDGVTRGLRGFEALVRWRHPERGVLSPGAFIDAAEDSGLIAAISRWVVEEACRKIAEAQATHTLPEGFRIAVNVTARDVSDRSFLDHVLFSLDRFGADHGALTLEITESSIMSDPDVALANLARYRDAGVHLSIDDFGTGYSSLAYLTRYPAHVLKIDKSFIDHIVADEKNRAVVGAIIDVAHSIGLSIVGEGVENEEQARVLGALGCDRLQGYYFGKPADWASSLARLAPTLKTGAA